MELKYNIRYYTYNVSTQTFIESLLPQEYIVSGIDEKNGWNIPHWPTGDADWMDYQRDKIHFCEHKWVDTGMRKTFCKECNVEGDYDPMTNKVTVILKEKGK